MKTICKSSKSIICHDEIEFILVRGRVKNLNLRILHDGTVRLSAPINADMETILKFVSAKKEWIISHKDKLRPTENHFFYLGKEKSINSIDIPLKQFYTDNAIKIITERFNYQCDRLSISPKPSLIIKPMRGKYGSYTKNKHIVTINLLLIMAPLECIDYVIVHELTHVTHFDHSKAFHNALQEYVPQEKQLKAVLSRYILW